MQLGFKACAVLFLRDLVFAEAPSMSNKGKAGETFALPLRLKTVYQEILRP
jgi:hypothetical protein